MAGSLDYVRRGEAITAEKWNALVERINALEQERSFSFGVQKRPKGGGGTNVKLAQLTSAFSTVQGRMQATGKIVVNGTPTTDVVIFTQPGISFISYYAPGMFCYCYQDESEWRIFVQSAELKASVSNNALYLTAAISPWEMYA